MAILETETRVPAGLETEQRVVPVVHTGHGFFHHIAHGALAKLFAVSHQLVTSLTRCLKSTKQAILINLFDFIDKKAPTMPDQT
jgi:hypothetical protein